MTMTNMAFGRRRSLTVICLLLSRQGRTVQPTFFSSHCLVIFYFSYFVFRSQSLDYLRFISRLLFSEVVFEMVFGISSCNCQLGPGPFFLHIDGVNSSRENYRHV